MCSATLVPTRPLLARGPLLNGYCEDSHPPTAPQNTSGPHSFCSPADSTNLATKDLVPQEMHWMRVECGEKNGEVDEIAEAPYCPLCTG